MIFTAPDETRVQIDGSKVVRVRQTIHGENELASTRIDWLVMDLVKEPVEDVVLQIGGSLPGLTHLTGGNNVAIWFDANKADGPHPVPENIEKLGFQSLIKLGICDQYIVEDSETVRLVLASARQAAEKPADQSF